MADPPENPDAPAPTPDDADTLSNRDLEPTHAFEPVTSSRIGTKIGAFTLKRIIGSGGMGTVYEAMQEQPRRRVAVKMIKRGITSKSALRRFEFESQLLGRLQHPGIAQVYEAGTHDDGSGGVPYFAMEYIANAKSLTQYAQEKKLGTRERLALFAKVCDAVQHGHLKGIVHRDLKPGNILVDSSGQPKIIDFGVARSTDSDMAVTTLQTDVGQLVGTLQYMSPEQVEADPSDIDARSDVYALGVVLYELLTSKPPYDVRQAAIHEAVRMVREEEPTKLSTIDRHLRGDIETIALKALEKERERRYQSATELEQDISRYLNDEPIAAKAPGAIDHLRRFARKHKAAAASIAAIFVVLVLALVAISIFAVKAKQDRDSKDAAWRQALDVQLQLEHKRAQAFQQAYYANIHAATAAEAINDLTTASQRLQAAREAYESSGVFIDGGVIVEGNWTPEAGEEVFRRIIDEHVGGVSESGAHASDPLPFEWEYLSARLEDSISTLHGHEDHITSVAYSHDGALLASGSFDKTIRLWDTLSGTQVATLRGHDGLVSALYFSPDGTHLISGSSGLGMFGTHDPDRTIRTWNTQTGEATGEIIEIRDAELVTVFSFSPDGSQVAAGCKDNRIRLWDVQTGEVIATLSEVNLVSHALAVVFSPDGFHLASSHKNGMVLIWDTRTGEVIAGPLDHGLSYPKVYTLAFSPDGGRLATGDIGSNAVRGPGVIRIFDTTTGAVLLSLRGHDDSISCIDFSPNGTHLASTSGDKTLRIWDTAIGEELVSLRGHRDLPLTLAFSPDGTHLASGGLENDVRFWDANSIHASSKLSGHESTVVSLAFSPDGTRLASGSMDPYPEIKIWDMASLEEVASWDTTQFPFLTALSYSSDGTRLASGGAKSIRIWDVASGVATDLVDIVDNGAYINSISLSLGGTCLATAHMDDTIRIWDIKSGEELQTLRVPEERAAATSEPPSRSTRFDGIQIALSPDGDLLASAMYDGIIRYWDVPSGEELVHLQGHVDVRNTTSRLTSAFCSIAFSPDGTRLATGGSDKIARIWDTTSGEELRTLIGHESPVKWVAFSPDSTRLLSSTTRGLRQDDTRLWDAVSGEQILVLNGGGGATAYSPDGTRLATSAYDNSIRLYNTRSRSQLGQERRQALNLAQLLSPLVESWMEIANGDSEVALALLDRESKNRSIEEATALSNLVLASLSTQIRIEKFYRDIETWWDNAETLNDGIWDEVTSKNKDFVAAILDEALRGMQRACELTHFEDSVTLDTLARVHYEMGELDKAILWQREAVKFIDGDLGFREGITQTLADYEAQRSEAARLPESAVSP